jgi:hypothetical protein
MDAHAGHHVAKAGHQLRAIAQLLARPFAGLAHQQLGIEAAQPGHRAGLERRLVHACQGAALGTGMFGRVLGDAARRGREQQHRPLAFRRLQALGEPAVAAADRDGDRGARRLRLDEHLRFELGVQERAAPLPADAQVETLRRGELVDVVEAPPHQPHARGRRELVNSFVKFGDGARRQGGVNHQFGSHDCLEETD